MSIATSPCRRRGSLSCRHVITSSQACVSRPARRARPDASKNRANRRIRPRVPSSSSRYQIVTLGRSSSSLTPSRVVIRALSWWPSSSGFLTRVRSSISPREDLELGRFIIILPTFLLYLFVLYLYFHLSSVWIDQSKLIGNQSDQLWSIFDRVVNNRNNHRFCDSV